MTQEEFNAWITAQGGSRAVQFANENRTIPNPAKKDAANAIDATIPDTITVNTLTWVNPTTGAKLSLSPKGPGEYDVLADVGAKPPTAAADPTVPANRHAEELQRQRERNAALPAGQDPRYETDAERATRAAAAIKEQGAAKPASSIVSSRTVKDETTGQTVKVNKHQDGTETRAEESVIAKPEKPQDFREADGRITRVHPDGRIEELRAKDPEKQETVTRDGKTFVIERDPTTLAVTGEREVPRSEINTAPPASATGWTPDLNKPAYGLQERFQEIARRQALAPTDPDYLTTTQAKQVYEQDKAVAETYLAQAQGITTAQSGIHGQNITQRGNDQTVANQRLTSSINATTNALSAADAGQHGGAATMQLLDLYYRQAERYGGTKDVPREQLPPALASINTLNPFAPGGMTGAAPAAPAGPAPAPIPGTPLEGTPVAPTPSSWPGWNSRSMAPETAPLPMVPTAPSSPELPVALATAPPPASLMSSPGAPVPSLAMPQVQYGFDPNQIVGLDPYAPLRQNIARSYLERFMAGGV